MPNDVINFECSNYFIAIYQVSTDVSGEDRGTVGLDPLTPRPEKSQSYRVS